MSRAVVLVVVVMFVAACAPQSEAISDSQDALGRLKKGNLRFSENHPTHPHEGAARLRETSVGGQHPFAVVVACSDSRVPVELLFDQGIGDLFVIRVAGNVCGEDELASIEYAVEHFGVRLVVILGHSQCGAVTAVVQGAKEHSHIDHLLQRIDPAVKAARRESPLLAGEELIAASVRQNVLHTMEELLKGNCLPSCVSA
ncbi:MAG: carbonic anhydrase [Planctomycetes bacterium]|nr:carbonic anhydrase [Planctomycetota bacterium]